MTLDSCCLPSVECRDDELVLALEPLERVPQHDLAAEPVHAEHLAVAAVEFVPGGADTLSCCGYSFHSFGGNKLYS